MTHKVDIDDWDLESWTDEFKPLAKKIAVEAIEWFIASGDTLATITLDGVMLEVPNVPAILFPWKDNRNENKFLPSEGEGYYALLGLSILDLKTVRGLLHFIKQELEDRGIPYPPPDDADERWWQTR